MKKVNFIKFLKAAKMTKKYNNLYKKVINYSNLENGYKESTRGKKALKGSAIYFSMCKEYNLVNVWRSLRNKTYSMDSYIKFEVYEPKRRIVNAPRFKDKIVQFALHSVINEIFENVFIKDSYACRKNKGTHRAVEAVQHYMKLCNWKYGNGWIIKLDVAKFFYSIDREILKKLIRKKIACKDTLQLIDVIIDSYNESEKGIPLGNITSQLFANIYLNELDQFCKRYLKIKWYVRYMDDVIVIVNTKEKAQEILEKMKWFLDKFLDLHTNSKTKIFPLHQGVNAYGYKIWHTHKLLRDQSKRVMKRKIKAMDKKKENGTLTEKEIKQVVDSWLGHARHSNSYNLCKKIFQNYKYIEIEGDEKYGRIFRSS